MAVKEIYLLQEKVITIDHIALWADDIDKLKDFYVKYFSATAGKKYSNVSKKFTSYFLTFPKGGTKLEIMNVPDIVTRNQDVTTKGLCHISISVGSKKIVDELTEKMRIDGVSIIGNPRTTGDGYYESVIADVEGNIVEITI